MDDCCVIIALIENYISLIYLSSDTVVANNIYIYISFATTVSEHKMCDFSGETFKGFEVLYFSMSATMTQPLSSGEFLRTAL